MNFAELKDSIRVEAQLKDADSMQATINRLVNSEFRKYTAKSRYPELLVGPTILPFAGFPVAGTFDLPTDFQHFYSLTWNGRSIGFLGGVKNSSRPQRILENVDPKYAIIVGQQILMQPGERFLSTDEIFFSYYRSFLLQSDTDSHPVTALEDTVILAVAARILFITSSTRFKAAKDLESQSFIGARGEYVAR